MRECFFPVLLLTLVTVAALCGPATAQQGRSEGRSWPLAVRIHSYGAYQEAGWAHLRQIGVKYVFMSVPPRDEVDAALEKLQGLGLKPLVLRGSADLSKDTFVEEITPQLAACEKMGVKYMFLSAKRKDTPKERAYERLRAAGDVAKRHGVVIALETHPDLGTNGDVQRETMQGVNHPNIRVNFDTANITYYNKDTSAVSELAKSAGFVGTVEFKDHSGGFETWVFPPAGQGAVDLPGVIRLLREHDYAGPVTIEFEGTKGVDLSEEQTKLAIAESVAYVRSLAHFE